MTAEYSKRILSGSTNGKQIKVAETATPGTLIHTAVAGTDDYDEVWLYCSNNSTTATNLTLEWGGVSTPDDIIQMSIPAKTGLYLIIPGLVLQNGLSIRAFASVANMLVISGWVNRIEVA